MTLVVDPAGFPPARGMGQLSAADVLISEVPLNQLVAISAEAGLPREQRVNVTPGVTDMILNRTVGGASYITLQIQDRSRQILRSKIFSDFGLVLALDGLNFALVQFAKQGDELQIQFEAALAYDLRLQSGAFNFASATNLAGFAQRLLTNPPTGKGFTGQAIPGATLKAEAGPVSFDTGSGVTASTTTSTSYPIARGTTSVPNEDSWTALNRVGAAAGWRVFECEGELVIGSDQWLIDDFPSLGTIREFTPGVANIDGTYDIGMPLGQLTVTAMCATWPYKPGDHVTVAGMGKFNGEWYVYAMRRDLFNPQGSMTLQRPMNPEQVRLGAPTLQYV